MKEACAKANGSLLKSSRELAAMLKQLPKEERFRVEGIIIGIGLRCGDPPPAVRDSA